MPDSIENAKVAIYWDFENIHACLIDRKYGRENYVHNRYRPQDALVEIEPILDYASSIGDIVIHKAYCNWQFFGKYQDRINTAGMDLIQIFPRGWNAKNGADISLALDVLTDIQQHPHVTHVVIISNDTDFVSLAQKVKQSGRTVVGVGLPEANRYWQFSCNEFKQYDALRNLAGEPAQPQTKDASNEAYEALRKIGGLTSTGQIIADSHEVAPTLSTEPAGGVTNTLETAQTVLTKALRQMLDRYGENYFAKAGLKELMKRLDPAFDERSLGFVTFSSFLQNFPDIVTNVDGQHAAMVIPDVPPETPRITEPQKEKSE
jgi:uncharacterized LabA/DUF88 family protein